ncbi:carbamoyltransferase HypF [Helicobacter muridarum]|uniref:acylphosphatase n=1 Tax=Helicobacter muridarum TaxID=216 RepID=A0A377PVU4_9HELI|nr:Sua5/YciO/YrdC/YwlC family protein [Helicobacter muridarum]TLE00784.1 carbamoyltransferase HypF [Helicobacter muridarum]STQ86532.1 transcriptional regulator of hydrogenase activity [Helicobacter muridarum]
MSNKLLTFISQDKLFCKWHILQEKAKETKEDIHDFLKSLRILHKNNISTQTYQIQFFGNVQGVGFRPFVFGLANELRLSGFVRNMQDCTEIILTNNDTNPNNNYYEKIEILLFSILTACKKEEIASIKKAKPNKEEILTLKTTYENISSKLFKPSLAYINSFYITCHIEQRDIKGFHIIESKIATKSQTINISLPLDMGICKDCLKDMNNKDSRFYSYEFTSCINCGARYSIIESLPYDRKNTSMKQFTLCNDCKIDYNSPNNKRFHTEPISCNKCAILTRCYEINECTKSFNKSPIIQEKNSANKQNISIKNQNSKNQTYEEQGYGEQAFISLAKSLQNNQIGLYKGLGGFAFLANANSIESLNILRSIKARPHKPFVIMANTHRLYNLAILNNEAKSALQSLESPIIIALKSESYDLPNEVSNLATIGIMRPYTPALLSLFSYLPKDFVLIYTSANKKGDMIATDIKELDIAFILSQIKQAHSPNQSMIDKKYIAKIKQSSLVVFEYNRDIIHRVDDSIFMGIDIAKPDFAIDIKNDEPSKNPKNSYLANIKKTKDSKSSNSNYTQSQEQELSKISPQTNKSILRGAKKLRSLRLARGFAPLHIIQDELRIKKLSVGFGAMQKSSIAFGMNDSIIISPYLGDLFSASNCANFKENFSFFESIYGTPEIFITDKHHQYASTKIANSIADMCRLKGNTIQVESIYHHHAHFNALLLEARQKEGIGAIFDGSGLGDDNSIWGGEFLQGNLKSVERKLFFKPFRILGGEGNIKDCKKLTLSYCLENGLDIITQYLQENMPKIEFDMLQAIFNNKLNSTYTSSVGRLFDIAGFFCGLDSISYEGQSGELIASLAINVQELSECRESPYKLSTKYNDIEHKAYLLKYINFSPYSYEITQQGIDISACFCEMFEDSLRHIDKSIIALRFIDTLSFCIKDSLMKLGGDYVLFGGGVFANFVLCARIKQLLDSIGINSFFPRLPCNDYSISIGQIGFASQI